jgi:hypothetical protein
METRVEMKTPFSIFAKSENKRKFTHFSRKFSLSRKFSRKSFVPRLVFFDNFQPVFRIWIHFQMAPKSGSAFQMENFREKFLGTENFRENENFFCKKRKKNFAKFLLKYQNQNFCFNPNGDHMPIKICLGEKFHKCVSQVVRAASTLTGPTSSCTTINPKMAGPTCN